MSVLGDITWRPGEPANIERLRLRGDATVPVGTAPREQVLARGKWDGESLATMIAADLTFRFTRHTGKVVLETLVSGTLLDGNMMACGLSVKGGTNTAPKGTRRLPVWMSGE